MGIPKWCWIAPIFLISVRGGLHEVVRQSFYEEPQSSSPVPIPTQSPPPELMGMKEIVLFLTPEQVETLQSAGAVVQPYPEYEKDFAELQEQFRQSIEQENLQQYQAWMNPVEDQKEINEIQNYYKLLNIQEINDYLTQVTETTEVTTEKATTTPRYKYNKARQQYKEKEYSTPYVPKKASRTKISNLSNNAEYVRFLPNYEQENIQIIPYKALPLPPYRFEQIQANAYIHANEKAQENAYSQANSAVQQAALNVANEMAQQGVFNVANIESQQNVYSQANIRAPQNAFSQETAYSQATTEGQKNAYSQENIEAHRNAYSRANAQQNEFTQVNTKAQLHANSLANTYSQQNTYFQGDAVAQQNAFIVEAQRNKHSQAKTATHKNAYSQANVVTQQNVFTEANNQTHRNVYSQETTERQNNAYYQAKTNAQQTAFFQVNSQAQRNEYSEDNTQAKPDTYFQTNVVTQQNANLKTVGNTEAQRNVPANSVSQQIANIVATTEAQRNVYAQANAVSQQTANTKAHQNAYSQINKEKQRNLFKPIRPSRVQLPKRPEKPQGLEKVPAPVVTPIPTGKTYVISKSSNEFKETLTSIEGLPPLHPIIPLEEQQEKPGTPAKPAHTVQTHNLHQDRLSLLLAPLYQHQTITDTITRQKEELLKNEFNILTKLQKMKESPHYDYREYTAELEKLTRNFGHQNVLARIEASTVANTPTVFANQGSVTTESHPVELVKSTKVPMLVRIPKPHDVKIPASYPTPLEFMQPFGVPKPVAGGRRPLEGVRNVYVKVDKPYTIPTFAPFAEKQKIHIMVPINPEQFAIIRHIWEH